MSERLPTFVIVGAMRCGTTSFARWLGAHPEVLMAPQKEVHFFDDHYDRGVDWYQRQFAGSERYKAIGEATPNYMHDQKAFDRLADLLPSAKLIVMLRNPVDRAYSHYWMNKARGHEPDLTFEHAIEFESVRANNPDRVEWRRYSYKSRGLYIRQIEHILLRFRREALHFILMDDLKTRPLDEFASVCRFLGVDDRIAPSSIGKTVNESIQVRSVQVRSLSKVLPKKLKDIVGKLNSTPLTYPPILQQTRRDLSAYFKPTNDELATFLGRDLSMWDFH